MRLLLDEMISATVAEQLRASGRDVIAVQDAGLAHLRGPDDCVLLDHAVEQRRAVVTDNIPDFIRCHHARLAVSTDHFGLLFFTNDTFPRHRHGQFIRHLMAAVEHELDAHPGDEPSSWIRWLTARG